MRTALRSTWVRWRCKFPVSSRSRNLSNRFCDFSKMKYLLREGRWAFSCRWGSIPCIHLGYWGMWDVKPQPRRDSPVGVTPSARSYFARDSFIPAQKWSLLPEKPY